MLVMTLIPLVTACKADRTAAADSVVAKRVERGRYLVSTSACHDCHTPWKMTERGPEPDMTRMLSGHPSSLKVPRPPKLGDGPWNWVGAGSNTAFAGAWGVTFTANLTPDQNSGLGIWTEDMFLKAIRTGRHMGTSRPIMPPMPWAVYRNMTDEDLKSIYAYLRTIPPISNHVPQYLEPHEVEQALK
jgi:mono/diheme cytochrome c family protein